MDTPKIDAPTLQVQLFIKPIASCTMLHPTHHFAVSRLNATDLSLAPRGWFHPASWLAAAPAAASAEPGSAHASRPCVPPSLGVEHVPKRACAPWKGSQRRTAPPSMPARIPPPSSTYVVTLHRRFIYDVFTAEILSFHSITISKAKYIETKSPA
jgi:hypothetical protein